MTAVLGTEPLSPERRRWWERIDGANLVCVYFALLLVVPARLVLARIPLSVTPGVIIASMLGALWLCTHTLDSVNMAKGRMLVRSAVIVLLCSYLLSYGIGTQRFLPADEVNLADDGMIRILACCGMALFICDAVRGRDRINLMLKAMVAMIAIMATVGILQFGGIDLIPYFSGFPGLRSVSDNSYVLGRSSFARPSGTANHPIEFGLVCAVAVPFAAHFFMAARDRGERWVRWAVCLVLTASAAALSLSRTAIIGLIIAGIIMVFVLPGRRKIMAVAAFGGFIMAGGVLVPGLLGTLFNLFANMSDDSSITHRTQDYDQAFAQVALHPLVGRGFGTYLPFKYQLLDNQYLLTMIENGYFGLTVMILISLAGCYSAIRARMLSTDPEFRLLCASLLSGILMVGIGMATFDLLSFGDATGILFALAGASGAILRTARAEADPDRPRRRGWLQRPPEQSEAVG